MVADPHEIALAVYDLTGDDPEAISEVAAALSARARTLLEEKGQPMLRLVNG